MLRLNGRRENGRQGTLLGHPGREADILRRIKEALAMNNPISITTSNILRRTSRQVAQAVCIARVLRTFQRQFGLVVRVPDAAFLLNKALA